MKFICELPKEIQDEIKAEIIGIANKIGLEFPYQVDDVTYCETVEDYANDIVEHEKLINILGADSAFINGEEVNLLLDYDKYKKFL